ncbi:hypothetical protein [Rhodocyclus gracilis]|uniref:Uncharacterized protein n=1 Tax=Rhodocyclus tenuis TaxID=1066 RepID=A0A6L5JXL4_RHOTE|nr:hypothetical protein [Rhodocyclus gracilis]MQY51771.1 hypothetical protein [Rhodocyclus gracilis]
MDKQKLINAIRRSGGKQNAVDEANDLWVRLDCLRQTGRYDFLLKQLSKANDKSNFLALVLEANFAYQFEASGLELTYEVKQDVRHESSIDFLRKAPSGDLIYFELRLLQQRQSILDSIKTQLQKCTMFRVFMDWEAEQEEVARIQSTVLSKVQDKRGNPIKFFSTAAKAINVVVIDATDSILGTIDVHDCKLAAYGDPGVEEVYRRQVFGFFQADKPEYPQHIRELAARYLHIRNTLHGVLFLFKRPNTGILAYQLEQYLMWNPSLLDETRVQPIYADVTSAIPTRR